MKWTVGNKITGMNTIAVIALLLIGITNYYLINKMVDAIEWQQHTYQVKNSIETVLSLVVDIETSQRGYLITRQDRYLEPLRNAETKIPNVIVMLRQLTQDNPNQQSRLDVLTPLINNKITLVKSSLSITDSKQELLILDQGKKIMDEIRQYIKLMNDNEDSLLSQRIKDSDKYVARTLSAIMYETIIAIIFLIIIGKFIIENISKPLKLMTETAVKISRGEIDNTFSPLNRQDEVGVLSQAFYSMSKTLQDYSQAATRISTGDLTVKIIPQSNMDALGNALSMMIQNLRQLTIDNNEVINLLNSSVNEIFTSTSQLVSSGTETAIAVNETTSTIEEVKQTSQISSQKAKFVSDDAQIASQISIEGNKSMQETNDGMTRIRDQMLSIAESMMNLSEQTQCISSIVETVDDLAQQSNLLSVNASIEAEKAGDQGKGFRIVAQEIKSLADQSKQATHRVREILTDVQKATNTAVFATEQGNKVAEDGLRKSQEAGDAIVKLSSSIMDAAHAAIQISTSSQQQLIGMEQAASAMENIKQASGQNIDSAKQLEIAAHNLKGISLKLQELIKKYRVTAE